MAMSMGARPAIRLTLRETTNEASDLGLLRSVVDLVHAYPGNDILLLTVVTLDGERHRFMWRVGACRELRFLLASLLAAWAGPRPHSGTAG